MRALRCGLVGLLLLASQVGNAADLPLFTPAEQQWMREHPVVRYAIDPYWPAEYLENGEHRGITRAYIDHVAQVSGLRFERVPTANWQETLERMQNGDIDLSSAVSERLLMETTRQQLLLSKPYFHGSTVLITQAGEPIMYSPQKLNGRTVAVKGGGGYEAYLREHFPGVHLLLIPDAEGTLAAVVDGRADAAIGMDKVLQPVIQRKYPGFLHLSGVLSQMPVVIAMGVSPKDPELVSIINKSLDTLSARAANQMLDRWIEDTDFGEPSTTAILFYYCREFAALAIGLILLIAFARYARQAQRRAQRNEADKSAFLALMSHEIRTPMNAVVSSVELLQRSRLDAHQQELVNLANQSADNLLDLLDSVLDASRLEAKGIELDRAPIDLLGIAQGQFEVYRVLAAPRGNSVQLHCNGLEGIDLMLDAVRIRQVLSNLLSNAVKFTRDGQITLSVNFTPSLPDEGELRIAVRDTGIGIEPAQQGRLFQAFAQADNSTTRRFGGSGLGLSICKQLIELMGGRIELQSAPGLGTQVSCVLGVRYVRRDAGLENSPPDVPAHDLAPAGVKYVLVVEDLPVNQQAIGMQLTELGYRALMVDDGLMALEALKNRDEVALVLLDCCLPGMDGYEVARRIREQEHTQGLEHLPIIAISATTGEEHQLKCIDAGMDGQLSKPLRLAQLRDLLSIWVAAPEGLATEIQANPPLVALSHQLFVDSCREDLQRLRAACEQQDLQHALHYAHRLYGAALTVNASEIGGLAGALDGRLRKHATIDGEWRGTLLELDKALERYNEADHSG